MTGDATMNASDLVKSDPVANELRKMSSEQVLSLAMHEACTVHILVAKAFCRHPELILTKPREFAVLLKAMVASMRAINNLHVQVLDLVRTQDETRAASAFKG